MNEPHLTDEDKAILKSYADQAQAYVRDLFQSIFGRPVNQGEIEAWRVGFEMGMEAGLVGSMEALKKLIDSGDIIPGDAPGPTV